MVLKPLRVDLLTAVSDPCAAYVLCCMWTKRYHTNLRKMRKFSEIQYVLLCTYVRRPAIHPSWENVEQSGFVLWLSVMIIRDDLICKRVSRQGQKWRGKKERYTRKNKASHFHAFLEIIALPVRRPPQMEEFEKVLSSKNCRPWTWFLTVCSASEEEGPSSKHCIHTSGLRGKLIKFSLFPLSSQCSKIRDTIDFSLSACHPSAFSLFKCPQPYKLPAARRREQGKRDNTKGNKSQSWYYFLGHFFSSSLSWNLLIDILLSLLFSTFHILRGIIVVITVPSMCD